MDDLDDIATTSRQEIIKDSPRYEELKNWMKDELFISVISGMNGVLRK